VGTRRVSGTRSWWGRWDDGVIPGHPRPRRHLEQPHMHAGRSHTTEQPAQNLFPVQKFQPRIPNETGTTSFAPFPTGQAPLGQERALFRGLAAWKREPNAPVYSAGRATLFSFSIQSKKSRATGV
jgi:hypothetical protein